MLCTLCLSAACAEVKYDAEHGGDRHRPVLAVQWSYKWLTGVKVLPA